MAFQRSWQPFVTLPIGIWWKMLLDAVALWHPWTVGSSGAACRKSSSALLKGSTFTFFLNFGRNFLVKNVPKLWQIYTSVRYIQSNRGHLPVRIAHCKNQFCLGHLAANAQIWVFTMRILSNMRKAGVTVSPLSPLEDKKSPLSSRGGQNQPNLYLIQRNWTRIASRMQLCHLPPPKKNLRSAHDLSIFNSSTTNWTLF